MSATTGPTPHNFTIRDDAGTILGATQDLSTGETAVLTVTFPVAGTYITFCSLPGHESLGVKGTLVVVDTDVDGFAFRLTDGVTSRLTLPPTPNAAGVPPGGVSCCHRHGRSATMRSPVADLPHRVATRGARCLFTH